MQASVTRVDGQNPVPGYAGIAYVLQALQVKRKRVCGGSYQGGRGGYEFPNGIT